MRSFWQQLKCAIGFALVLAVNSISLAQGTDLTAKVTRGDLKIEVEISGEFVADDKDEIRMEPSKYRGDLIITKILPEGSVVKKGDVLMEFDPDKLDDALEKAQNENTDQQVAFKKAMAELESAKIDAESKLVQLEKEFEFLEREIAAAQDRQELELAEKKKAIADDESALADARVDHEQLVQLYGERELHTTTEDMLVERSKKKLTDSEKSIATKKKELVHFQKYEMTTATEEKQLEADRKSAEIKKEKITLESAVAEKQAVVDKAQRKLDSFKKKIDGLEKDKAQLLVNSPRDGILFYKTLGGSSPLGMLGLGSGDESMEVGGRVKTHTILLTVATMENLTVKMLVRENDVQHMKKGLPITVRPDAFPALQLDGKLTKVDQIASRTDVFSNARRFTVRGKFSQGAQELKTGMSCRVIVHADVVPDTIKVPIVSVAEESGVYFCHVKTEAGFEKREIKIGQSNAEFVQVTEGLRTGEIVFLNDPSDK